MYFVTGASKGIGLSVVVEALKAGNYIAASSRYAEKLQAVVNEKVTTDADHFLPIEMNFDEASIKSAVDKIIAEWGKLDVLVNNAGYAILGAFEEFSIEEVKQNFDVNVFGLMEVTQAVYHTCVNSKVDTLLTWPLFQERLLVLVRQFIQQPKLL